MAKLLIYISFSILVILAFTVLDGARAQMVTDGLIAYWPLDQETIEGETVKDVWGGNDGTLSGDPKAATGMIGGALEFDGDDSVDIPGTDALDFNGAEELTVSAWFQATSDNPCVGVVANCCGTIVAQRDVNGWALRYDGRNSGKEIEFIVCPNWQGDSGFGAPVSVGEWHYATAVVDKSNMLIYLDGDLVEEMTFAGPISTQGTETEIGGASDGGFIGLIDEVTIYGRALSADEIKQNFASKGLAVHSAGKLATLWGKEKQRN